MSVRIAVDGIGLVGGFGCGVEDAIKAIIDGGKPNGEAEAVTVDGKRDVPVYLANIEELYRFIGKKKLRRVSRLSRLAVLGACLAIEDAAGEIPLDSDRVGVIVATGYGASSCTFGFLNTIIDAGDALASPTLFSNSVDSSAACMVTIQLQILGPCLTVMQFEMSPLAGLIAARQWLTDGRVDRVLVGAVDEINDVLMYCREQFFAGSNDGPVLPLEFDRQSSVAGEGVAFMLLRRDEGPPPKYGFIGDLTWARADSADVARLCDNEQVILGAVGDRKLGFKYQSMLATGREYRSFADVYGGIPSGQGFDVALSLLAMNRGQLAGQARCVKLDREGNCGVVDLQGLA